MTIDDAIDHACQRVPGLVCGALVFVAEGFLLGATRGARIFDLEPLIRSVRRCFASRMTPVLGGRRVDPFTEFVFVTPDQFVVIQGGRRDRRTALVVVASRDSNVAFVQSATRLVMGEVEEAVDLAAWGL